MFKYINLLVFIAGCLAYDDAFYNSCKIKLDFQPAMLGLAVKNKEIKDVSTGTEFFRFKLPNDVYSHSFDFYQHPQLATVEMADSNKTVIVRPNNNLGKVDELLHSQKSEIYEIDIRMQFYCGDHYERSVFDFIQPIKDTNNHSPRFNRNIYNYHFGMPVKQGARLTELMEVFASDLDFSNTEIQFSVEKNDFIEITYDENRRSPDKVYFAVLSTTSELSKGFKKSFEITAKDNGQPPKEATATVKISID